MTEEQAGPAPDRQARDRSAAELGAAQSTLFIPLTARAKETRRRHPALRDPKAIEILESVDSVVAGFDGRGWCGFVTVVRTLVFDHWIREFLVRDPGGTVVELGTGLNTRFERIDNGTAGWIDLDLPDVIELRRRFFADEGRRRMIAASLAGQDWLDQVAARPGPYFFVADGVLPYVPPDEVEATLTRIAARFPGASLAFDAYPRRAMEIQHQQAAKRGMAARWAWACDDPKSLERLGLRLMESASVTHPPPALRRKLPARYRYLLPLADPVLGKNILALSLFRAERA
ncbi:MAG: class I SAM-dependent methyltransferase [Nocardiopsaceae bacterium]|nr:class I SAM-dependent methyltransferase [Nocardiopsaceae bacterium]